MQLGRRIERAEECTDKPGREDVVDVDAIADDAERDERAALQYGADHPAKAPRADRDDPGENRRIQRLLDVRGQWSPNTVGDESRGSRESDLAQEIDAAPGVGGRKL